MDLIAELRSLQDVEVRRRKEIKGNVWKSRKMEEWIWLQKSRVNCALKGERNTRYFHIMATKRHNRHLMDSITVNGISYNNPMEKK